MRRKIGEITYKKGSSLERTKDLWASIWKNKGELFGKVYFCTNLDYRDYFYDNLINPFEEKTGYELKFQEMLNDVPSWVEIEDDREIYLITPFEALQERVLDQLISSLKVILDIKVNMTKDLDYLEDEFLDKQLE